MSTMASTRLAAASTSALACVRGLPISVVISLARSFASSLSDWAYRRKHAALSDAGVDAHFRCARDASTNFRATLMSSSAETRATTAPVAGFVT